MERPGQWTKCTACKSRSGATMDGRSQPSNSRKATNRARISGHSTGTPIPAPALMGSKSNLWRPSENDLPVERMAPRPKCWHIYYGDVHVGTIAERVGNPHDTDPQGCNCGFYPGSRPGKHQSDTSATFEEARADFGSAWQVFLSKRTEADFQEVARTARLDRAKICAVGCWRAEIDS